MSVPQWAGMTGLTDEDKSLATARGLIAKGEGPKVTKVMRRTRNGPVAVDGVRLVDHQAWARSQPWAKYLATLTASECEKRQRLKDKGRSRAWAPYTSNKRRVANKREAARAMREPPQRLLAGRL